MKIITSEHDAYKRMSEGLDQAIDGCKTMAVHRPAVGFMWLKMAESLSVCKMSVNKLADEAAVKTLKRKP